MLALPGINGRCVNEAEPWPEDAPGGDASAPGSSDFVDLGSNELGCRATLEHRPCLLAGGRWMEA
jgi:hypothetical protein